MISSKSSKSNLSMVSSFLVIFFVSFGLMLLGFAMVSMTASAALVNSSLSVFPVASKATSANVTSSKKRNAMVEKQRVCYILLALFRSSAFFAELDEVCKFSIVFIVGFALDTQAFVGGAKGFRVGSEHARDA